jgi:menaquinone-specific isochorismate synthase
MTVTPHRQLHSAPSKTSLLALERSSTGLRSASVLLPTLDPLVVLAELAAEYPHYFYWEQADRAVAAFGIAATRQFSGSDRFADAEAFVSQIAGQLSGETGSVRPLLYCYFPFFERAKTTEPFDTSALCLPQWQIERRGDRCFLVANSPTSLPLEIFQRAIDNLVARLGRLVGTTIPDQPQPLWEEAPEVCLETQIRQALTDIEQQHLQKIVLAHSRQLTAPQAFSIPRSLANLRHHYPDCYTFAVSNGQGQCFLGASPERLLAVRGSHGETPGERQLTSDALAGSAPRGISPEVDRQLATALLSSIKEQHEHRLVRDFIVEKLQSLQLRPTWPGQPQLLRLTNIQHIWTPIQAALPPALSPLSVLAALHPTPAVAGLPQALACQKIQEYEQITRGLYAAPLGWLDLAGDGELVVGIRSALVDDRQAQLYAGAGIVAGSQAAQEVAEIQLKFQPLYRALSI